MDKFYNFDGCRTSLKEFGGSDTKESIFYNGDRYMIKFNDIIPEDKRNEFTSTSRNNAFSEYISCHIFDLFGIPVQETFLGEKNGHIVVACKDFCVNGYGINEFEKNSSKAGIDFKNIRYPAIEDVLSFIRKDTRVNPLENEKRFWDTFVMDSLLANFDRHTGNWGYIFNDDKQDIRLAPVYDCGACLYPMVADSGMKPIIVSEKEINTRIYVYPKAAFTYKNEKISYHVFMTNPDVLNEYSLLKNSIEEIMEKYDRASINDIIENTPKLSEIRTIFYETMIRERFEKILEPAYKTTRNISIGSSQANVDRKVTEAIPESYNRISHR